MKYLTANLEEIQLWRDRARNGDYPEDFKRIKEQAEAFVLDPLSEVWVGDPTTGCVQKGDEYEPHKEGRGCKDAAFMYLITGDRKYYKAVKLLLDVQVVVKETDFSNRSRWCEGKIRDQNPGFFIAAWATCLLFAYDWIGLHDDKIDLWFLNAGKYFQKNVDRDLSLVFNKRLIEDYELSKYAKDVKIETIQDGISNLSRFYNNRRASMVRFYALVGLKLEDEVLKNSAKMFVKEWLKFSVYPSGDIGEIKERATAANPSMGLYYASLTLGEIADIADSFYRQGDDELYKYYTSVGLFGTDGGVKTIYNTVKRLLDHLSGNVNPLVIGKASNWNVVNHIFFAKPNLFWNDHRIEKAYKQKFPEPAAKLGSHIPWGGMWETYPGVLFMYAAEKPTVKVPIGEHKAEFDGRTFTVKIHS